MLSSSDYESLHHVTLTFLLLLHFTSRYSRQHFVLKHPQYLLV